MSAHSIYLGLIQFEAIYNNHIAHVFIDQLVAAKTGRVCATSSQALGLGTASQIQGGASVLFLMVYAFNSTWNSVTLLLVLNLGRENSPRIRCGVLQQG